MFAFRVLQGAGWLVFSRFLGRGIDFFTLLILARVLTPADFGLVALAMSLVVVIDAILEIPVTQALVRLEEIDDQHLHTAFTLSMARSVLLATIVFVALWPFAVLNHKPQLIPLIAFLALGPFIKGFYSPAMVHYVRGLGFKQTFLLEFGGKIFAFAAAVVTLFAGGSYWAIAANFVGASAASTLISYWLAPYLPRFSLARLRDFSGFMGWFTAAQLVSAANWQYDRLLIGLASDQASLGRYAVASDVATTPTQSLIGPALQPVMAAFAMISKDRDRLKKAFLKAARFVMMISVPASVGLSLSSDLAIRLMLGANWVEATPYLSILALSVIPIPYFQTLYAACLATDQPHIVFRINVIDLCVRVVLLGAGFYLASSLGVSVARVILCIIMGVLYAYYVKSVLGLSIIEQLGNLWKICVAALVMAGVVILFRRSVPMNSAALVVQFGAVVAVGAAAYLGTLYAVGIRILFSGSRLELVDR